jgi:hypothetical protein
MRRMLPLPIPDTPRGSFYSYIRPKDARESTTNPFCQNAACHFVTARIGNA